jgi:transposase
MPRTRPPYPDEFRKKMVEVLRAGRTPHDLAMQFEPTAVTIRSWVNQADLDEGRRDRVTLAARRQLRRYLPRQVIYYPRFAGDFLVLLCHMRKEGEKSTARCT